MITVANIEISPRRDGFLATNRKITPKRVTGSIRWRKKIVYTLIYPQVVIFLSLLV